MDVPSVVLGCLLIFRPLSKCWFETVGFSNSFSKNSPSLVLRYQSNHWWFCRKLKEFFFKNPSHFSRFYYELLNILTGFLCSPLSIQKTLWKMPDYDRALVIFMGFYRVCKTLKFSLGFQNKSLVFLKHYNENLLCFQSLFFKDKQFDKIFIKAIFFLIED